MELEFTSNWVDLYRGIWTNILTTWPARKILEIGSFEGRSTCFFIEALSQAGTGEIYCIDTWEGGEEHADNDMSAVERRFHSNISLTREQSGSKVEVHPRKGLSFPLLNQLYAEGHAGSFDLAYVDGSHQAPDVLGDLVMSYHLLKAGGVMICDDYVWRHGNILHEPKLAIDSFSSIFRDTLTPIIDAPLRQIYFVKTR